MPHNTGRFERSEDGQTWTQIETQEARRKLSGTYRDVEGLLQVMMVDGNVVRTPFAFYRFQKSH